MSIGGVLVDLVLDEAGAMEDADAGIMLWSAETGPIYGSPAVADGLVYVGSWDSRVYCLLALNGAELWTFDADSHIYSSPAVVNGKVYMGSTDNNVYCIDAGFGTELWRYTTGDIIYRSTPARAPC